MIKHAVGWTMDMTSLCALTLSKQRTKRAEEVKLLGAGSCGQFSFRS